MSPQKRILVIGSGKRVVEAALPVIARARAHWTLDGVFSRKAKTIVSEGVEHEVQALDQLTPARLATIDLIYMVVSKPAVPKVLRRLESADRSRLDLLIETPVMLVRHLGHRHRLEAFRNVWVSEDCTTLPAFDVLKDFVATGAIGALHRATFDRSAYAYHGMAMVKTALGGGRILRARQKSAPQGLRERTVELANGRHATLIDPRDYAKGTLTFFGDTGRVSDVEPASPGVHRLEAVEAAGRCIAFRIGRVERRLTSDEIELMGERSEGVGVTAWMDGMKRVGFLELLQRIHDGHGAYPLEQAIEDSVVDYFLEKFGRYRATPFTRPDAAATRFAFSLLTRIAGR